MDAVSQASNTVLLIQLSQDGELQFARWRNKTYTTLDELKGETVGAQVGPVFLDMLNKKGLRERAATATPEPEDLARPLRRLRQAQRDRLPPVTRVRMALHP